MCEQPINMCADSNLLIEPTTVFWRLVIAVYESHALVPACRRRFSLLDVPYPSLTVPGALPSSPCRTSHVPHCCPTITLCVLHGPAQVQRHVVVKGFPTYQMPLI